jgi:heat shock protein HslJ
MWNSNQNNKMKMGKIFIITCMAASVCLGGCRTTRNATQSATQEQRTTASADNALVEKYWNLLELNGTPVTGGAKEAHIIFHAADSRFSGNAGCNTFSGSFTARDNARIELSQAVSTRMMCLDMQTETRFLEVLGRVDGYAVKGDTLTLSRARMAPLATFVAVNLR